MSDVSALSAKRIFDGEAWHEDSALIVRGGVAEAIVPREKIPAGAGIVEAGDMLAPGFVDLQVNGGGGVMLNDQPDVEGIETICRAQAPFGTTALLPTLITDTPEVHGGHGRRRHRSDALKVLRLRRTASRRPAPLHRARKARTTRS